jgi:uncharacterized protein (TIGR02611 family)
VARSKGDTVHEQRGEPPEHDRETVLDEVAERLGFRDVIRKRRSLDLVYRGLVGLLGFAIIITGFVLIPLPGPGWLIVFAGLALLATEFAWAERLLHFARDRFRAWTDWVRRQSLAVRGLLGLAGLVLVGGAVWGYVALKGVPGWVPVIG